MIGFRTLIASFQLLNTGDNSQMHTYDTPNGSTRPNLILIVGDDHDRSALGCYGNPQVSTPYLDELAKEGVRFTRAYTTTASCSPSRSVLLSGRHNHSNGMYGLAHSPHHFHSFNGTRSLPTILSQAGYHTVRIGKFHLVPEERYLFDEVLPGNGTNPVDMADQCADFFGRKAEQPFFLYFCPTDPHRTSPRRDLPYQPDAHGNSLAGHEGVTDVLYDPDTLQVPYFLPDSPESRAELAQYYQSVSRLDQGVGKLFDYLKESGLWDNTMVIYLSDNGMPVPGAKTTHYEPGVSLPLIVRNPLTARQGNVCDELVSWLDIAPTLIDYAGIPQPFDTLSSGNRIPFFQGKSRKSVVENPSATLSDTLFLSHSFHGLVQYYPMRTVVTRRYKLIYNLAHQLPFPFASDLWKSATWQAFLKANGQQYGKRAIATYHQRPPFELYDLEKDPYETSNKAYDAQYEAVFNDLLEAIKRQQRETGDPWLTKWEYQ